MQEKKVKIQARSNLSRQLVLDAVIELINDEGFSATSTAKIQNRAGVSWGVLQYHFGGKQQIFEAVLERSTSRLIQAAEELIANPATLQTAIDKLWHYYSNADYRAGVEILLNHAHLDNDLYLLGTATHDRLMKFFRKLFRRAGYRCSAKQSDAIAEFIICSLRGMAVGNAMFQKHPRDYRLQRKMLVEAVEYRLSKPRDLSD